MRHAWGRGPYEHRDAQSCPTHSPELKCHSLSCAVNAATKTAATVASRDSFIVAVTITTHTVTCLDLR